MGLIEIASGNSVWRGMDYYEQKKVLTWEHSGNDEYNGTVSGSNGEVYKVHIDKMHPKKSTCNCAFAEGRRVVCKHMIALLFTAEPQTAEEFMKEVEQYEAEEDERRQERLAELEHYVKSLTKAELQMRLLDYMIAEDESRDRYW